MSHIMTSRVSSSATRLLALLGSSAGAPQRHVDTLASTIMAKAITMIQARTSWIFSGVLRFQKNSNWFSSDSRVLTSGRLSFDVI